MPKMKMKYRIPLFVGVALTWELIFWLLAWRSLSVLGVFMKNSSGDRMTFLHPEYGKYNYVIIPFIFGVFLFQMVKRNQFVGKWKESTIVHSFLRPISTLKIFIRYFFIRNALVFAVFALMQPAIGMKTVTGTTRGIDLIFTVDVSNSMNTRDIKGGDSRLMVAKRVMNQMINQSSAARVGLLIFAGNTYPQLPLTTDIDAAKLYIDGLSTSLVSNQGTHVSKALIESSKFFDDSKKETQKVLVLITDGEDHEGGMREAYKVLKEKNPVVFVLGIGTEEGGIVPQSDKPGARPMMDDLGRAVNSKVNRSMLKEMARELNGEFLLTSDPFPNISQFLTLINTKSETNAVDLEFKVKENRYQWPLALALTFLFMLLIWESFPTKKTKE